MMQGLPRRIERLEAKQNELNGLYVVSIYEGETEEEARQLGGVPDNAELVVLIRQFFSTRQGDDKCDP